MKIVQAESTEGVIKESRITLEYSTEGRCWGWRSFGAFVGMFGGIVTAVVGSIFTASTWLTGLKGNGAYMQTLGTDFLVLTIPLLVLGAHCMDLVEKEKKRKESKLSCK